MNRPKVENLHSTPSKPVSVNISSGLRAIRAFISKRVHNQEDVNDLVQDTFERTLKQLDLKEVEFPVAYAHQVAKNLVVDFWRSKYRLEQEHDDEVHCERPNPEQMSLSEAHSEAFKQILEEMPPLRREVLLLKRFDGLSRAEIAAKLSITDDAVKKHITRALIDLKLGMQKRGW